MSYFFRRAGLGPALIAASGLSVAALGVSPAASARWGGAEPCVLSNGKTLKQEYGYSVAVVTSSCAEVRAGERWAVSVPWVMDRFFEQKPSGFATDYATPVDDFRGKLKSIAYVVDPGTAYQSNRSFPGDNKIWEHEMPTARGLPAVDTVSLGSLDPLPIGTHTVEVSWKFSAPVCDGFSADQGTSCLPQGDILVKRITFRVVDPYTNGPQS